MKAIQLNHGTLELPEDWSELTSRQRRKGFIWLAEMTAGKMTPFEWQFRMLFLITGYKPSRRQSDTVRENLIRIAEQINFAFSLKDDADGRTQIRLNYDMRDCPVDSPRDATYWPRFKRDRIIDTNLTARQYSEATQLLQAIADCSNEADAKFYADRLANTLVRDEYEWEPWELFALRMWFTGIVLFWQHHPVYSVLYESNQADNSVNSDSDKIQLGLQEVILELTEKGYPDAANMPLPDFFDAQVKMLRDNLHEAKANGVKLPDLVQKTGIPLRNINRLL